jgi:hypothetical protein
VHRSRHQNSTLYHFITLSLYHFITLSLYHFIILKRESASALGRTPNIVKARRLLPDNWTIHDQQSNMHITHGYVRLYAPIWAFFHDPAFFLLFFSKNPMWGEVWRKAG